MDSEGILFISAVVLLIWTYIMYQIILVATKSSKIEKEMRKQTLLLAKMAFKAGIEPEEINYILNNSTLKPKISNQTNSPDL